MLTTINEAVHAWHCDRCGKPVEYPVSIVIKDYTGATITEKRFDFCEECVKGITVEELCDSIRLGSVED